MPANSELLKKADLALSDLTSNGGLLNPEQAKTFIRKLIKSPTLLSQIRVVGMSAPTRNIDKIQFGTRILRKATSATALADSKRSKPTTEKVTLTTKEVIAEVRLSYDVLEDNIESATTATNGASNAGAGGLHTTLVELIAERAALDLESLGLLGDTAYSDGDAEEQEFYQLFDGWLKVGSERGNIVDYQNKTIDKALMKAGKKAMPDQYLRNQALLKHFVSVDQETELRDTYANRGTALGDAAVQGNIPLRTFGSDVNAVSQMPESKGLFTDPRNLIMGVQRDISMEYDKDIRSREYIIVLTARVAFEVEEDDALVYYKNIA